MDIIRGLMRSIKKIATGGRDAYRISQDFSYALQMAKQKILSFLKTVFKTLISQVILYSIVIVLLIAAVTMVFGLFTLHNSASSEGFQDLDPRAMGEWADSLTDEEIKDMQDIGMSIHPRKIKHYTDIEDESYQKNVNINIPVQTRTWGTDVGESTANSEKEYIYARGDTSYPFRQWWQSTAGIDAINNTSHLENKLKIIEDVKEELKPIFVWADIKTESYVEGNTYVKKNPLDLESTTLEEKVIMTTTTTTVSSEDGTSVYVEEVTTWRPLPLLSSVDTMFSSHNYVYEPTVDIEESSAIPRTTEHTRTKTVINKETGEEEEKETTYTITKYVDYKTEVHSYELVEESKEEVTRFMDFLDANKIDTYADPLVMYYMTENFPQSYDFNNIFKEYIDYMGLVEYYGGGYVNAEYFDGDFGDYTGGLMMFPVPSASRISSYFGYRIHPVLKTRKLHTGIDIPGNMGVDVVAGGNGIVSFVGPKGTYGNVVMINHGSGIETLYAHNSNLVVSAGQSVTRGQVIAKVGSTGRSTGPHSHFEVRKNGKATDPIPWLVR